MRTRDNFRQSEYADSIHYADLFTINGLNWAILGYGKSTAARHASKKQRAADLGRDCLAMFMVNGRLHGRYDPGMIHDNNDEGLFTAHPIDVVAYCIPAESTQHLFGQRTPEIVSCSCELLAAFTMHHPYPAYMLPNEVTPSEWERLCDPERRAMNLLDLLQQASAAARLLIPWMETVEDKANLYLHYDPGKVKPMEEYNSKKKEAVS